MFKEVVEHFNLIEVVERVARIAFSDVLSRYSQEITSVHVKVRITARIRRFQFWRPWRRQRERGNVLHTRAETLKVVTKDFVRKMMTQQCQ